MWKIIRSQRGRTCDCEITKKTSTNIDIDITEGTIRVVDQINKI